MTTALDATALADLLDDLMAWLKANPGKDLDDFAEDHNCSVEDVSDAWNTYFSADFSRDYKIDNDYDGGYHPSPPPHGDPQALKSYIVKEVNTYQQYTTINNIEDNSFNQQIIAGGDVNQDIDIDNSDNIADDGGVVIRDSELDDTNVVTGDRNVVDSEGNNITGDVTTQVEDGGQAATNIGFGSGDVNNTQQNADVDVTNSGDNTGGAGGSADGDGGDGGISKADSDADGGDGGSGGDLDDPFLGVGGDGGDGGGASSSAGSSADGGDGAGGTAGDGGGAGNDTGVNVNF